MRLLYLAGAVVVVEAAVLGAISAGLGCVRLRSISASRLIVISSWNGRTRTSSTRNFQPGLRNNLKNESTRNGNQIPNRLNLKRRPDNKMNENADWSFCVSWTTSWSQGETQ